LNVEKLNVYKVYFRYFIKPLNNFEISLIFILISSNSSNEIYFKSKAKYNCDLNSPAEAFAIYKNRINSFVVSRSNPSAIFEEIEMLDLLI